MRLVAPVRLFERLGRDVRLQLARRRWIRWLAVAAAATVVGLSVQTRLSAVDSARERWEQLVRVPVATADVEPGAPLTWASRDVPAAVVPADVATTIPDDVVAQASIGVGEIIVNADLTAARGPAAAAAPGQTVVPISDPLATRPAVGLDVVVFGDGIVLAATGRIVLVDAEVVYVAVDHADAPLVAAAAQSRQASIAFVRP